MARRFAGSGSYFQYSTGLPASFQVNSNILVLATVKFTASSSGALIDAAGAGVGWSLRKNGLGLSVTKYGVEDGGASDALTANAWYTVAAQFSTGGNYNYKFYNIDSDTHSTDTVASTAVLNAPTGTSVGSIGVNWTLGAQILDDCDIHRIAVYTGSMPSDAEIEGFCNGSSITGTLLAGWLFEGSDPEDNYEGTADLDAVRTGTIDTVSGTDCGVGASDGNEGLLITAELIKDGSSFVLSALDKTIPRKY